MEKLFVYFKRTFSGFSFFFFSLFLLFLLAFFFFACVCVCISKTVQEDIEGQGFMSDVTQGKKMENKFKYD